MTPSSQMVVRPDSVTKFSVKSRVSFRQQFTKLVPFVRLLVRSIDRSRERERERERGRKKTDARRCISWLSQVESSVAARTRGKCRASRSRRRRRSVGSSSWDHPLASMALQPLPGGRVGPLLPLDCSGEPISKRTRGENERAG